MLCTVGYRSLNRSLYQFTNFIFNGFMNHWSKHYCNTIPLQFQYCGWLMKKQFETKKFIRNSPKDEIKCNNFVNTYNNNTIIFIIEYIKLLEKMWDDGSKNNNWIVLPVLSVPRFNVILFEHKDTIFDVFTNKNLVHYFSLGSFFDSIANKFHYSGKWISLS